MLSTPAMPLPHKVLLATSRLEEAAAHLDAVLCRQRIDARTTHTPFRHHGAHLGDVTINALYWGRDVRIDSEPSDDFIVLVMLHGLSFVYGPGGALRLAPGSAFIFNPGDAAHLHLGAGQCNVTIRVPSTVIQHFATQHCGRGDSRKLRFVTDQRMRITEPRATVRLVNAICQEIDNADSAFLRSTVSRSLQNAFFGLLLSEFAHNLAEPTARSRRTGAEAVVERAKRFVRENATTPISLGALADHVGCSVRGLQQAFRRLENVSPHEFIVRTRLDMARREFQFAAAHARSVSEVALACGFNHLGRFSALYRERFGEYPSEAHRGGRRSAAPSPERGGDGTRPTFDQPRIQIEQIEHATDRVVD